MSPMLLKVAFSMASETVLERAQTTGSLLGT